MSAQPANLIRITCADCGATFKVGAQHAGKKGRCPVDGCGAAYVVPTAQTRNPKLEIQNPKSESPPRPAVPQRTARKAVKPSSDVSDVTLDLSDDSAVPPPRRAVTRSRSVKRPARGIARRLWPLWS